MELVKNRSWSISRAHLDLEIVPIFCPYINTVAVNCLCHATVHKHVPVRNRNCTYSIPSTDSATKLVYKLFPAAVFFNKFDEDIQHRNKVIQVSRK